MIKLFLLGIVICNAFKISENFSWADVDGKNFLTYTRNQNSPQFCNGGWAFAVTGALSDRIKIKRNAAFPEIVLSTQVLISCDTQSDGCTSGTALNAYQYIKDNWIPDETCTNYVARKEECNEMAICKNCLEGMGCWAQHDYYIYTISSYGTLHGQIDIMQEVVKNGPVSCQHGQNNHYVEVVGWRTSGQSSYWIVKNTLGPKYPSLYEVPIEEIQECSYGEVIDTWTEGIRAKTQSNKKIEKRSQSKRKSYQLDMLQFLQLDQLIITPFSSLNADVPTQFDWRNVDGVNYLTNIRNQHIPVYCGSCWAHAVTSTISDRINIKLGNKYPVIILSVQSMLNCMSGGSCGGGLAQPTFKHAYLNGFTEEHCHTYEAINGKRVRCSDEDQCHQCNENGCEPVKHAKRYFVSEFGYVKTARDMKIEIFNRGPIVCGVYATQELDDYEGGYIFSQKTNKTILNHFVSVVGWGIEDGVEYWIVRNSWGTYWGEMGFAKIKMHSDNLLLEHYCSWGVPKL
ncbi:unnamed protein product [Paramecium primaurelia]|uniref:Peptidase C1A papain C-terminal domain-containing protein n=1 Tax=Paramecium primaurelia TaxID=5886 RepID=A0A8S1MEP8_PARPR|nr:unnamed protein product [Paramecium primaurelia]